MIVQTTLSDRIISQNIGTSAELKEALNTIDNLNNEIDELEETIETINLGYINRDKDLMVVIKEILDLL